MLGVIPQLNTKTKGLSKALQMTFSADDWWPWAAHLIQSRHLFY